MFKLFLVLTTLFKSNSFVILGNKFNTNNIFFSRLFERDDFIRQDLVKKKEIFLENTEQLDKISNTTIAESNNSTIRSGRSLDQDGKTNIWSIEPKMLIDESKENDLFKLFGIFASAILVTFQFFLLTNPIFPDPSDY